jgi:chemotaxis protein methyltransferase CheR
VSAQPASHAPFPDDYPAFCEGLARLSNVDLVQYRCPQMERRIRTFAQRRGKPALLDYLALLAADAGELDLLLDRVTINVSQLWRNPVQWQTIAQEVVPCLARAGGIRAWSAGCSYGAEAYTIAAICREIAPNAELEVHGSDIDERVITRARQGLFSDADLRTAPPRSVERWFERVADGWQVSDELRAVTRFTVENLLECTPKPAAYDLIACRNMVIYFTEQSRDALHTRLASALRPGGWLMVGSTERIVAAAAYGLELVYPFTYRRV